MPVLAGSFKMGDNFKGGDARERPVHMVELDAFYIEKYEVTNVEYRKFRDRGSKYPQFWPGGFAITEDQFSYWNGKTGLEVLSGSDICKNNLRTACMSRERYFEL